MQPTCHTFPTYARPVPAMLTGAAAGLSASFTRPHSWPTIQFLQPLHLVGPTHMATGYSMSAPPSYYPWYERPTLNTTYSSCRFYTLPVTGGYKHAWPTHYIWLAHRPQNAATPNILCMIRVEVVRDSTSRTTNKFLSDTCRVKQSIPPHKPSPSGPFRL